MTKPDTTHPFATVYPPRPKKPKPPRFLGCTCANCRPKK